MKNIYRFGSKSIALLALAVIMLAGCAAIVPGGSTTGQANFELPTPRPTVAPSPVSTRVMPIDSLTPAPTPSITPIPDETMGMVVEVFDGNTIAVVLNGDSMKMAYKVRYLGITTPPNAPADPWGVVAYETNHKLTNLKVVKLVRDKTDADADGYLLRYVYVGNQMINTELAQRGLAQAAITAPDTRFETEILKAEADAKAKGIGLWAGQPPTPTPQPTPRETRAAPPQAKKAITTTITLPVTATAEVTTTAVITGTVEPTPTAATPQAKSTPTRTPTAASTPVQAVTPASSGTPKMQGPN